MAELTPRMKELVQPYLAGIEPYDPNFTPTRINLSANENTYPVPAGVREAVDAALAASRFANEDRARTLLAKVVCLRQAGSKEDLLPLMAQAYELNPGNPSIALNYAQVLFDQDNAQKARFYVQRLNNSEGVSAASLWLGIKVERKLGDSVAVRQLAGQLVQRFPTSPEREKFEQGTFDECFDLSGDRNNVATGGGTCRSGICRCLAAPR